MLGLGVRVRFEGQVLGGGMGGDRGGRLEGKGAPTTARRHLHVLHAALLEDGQRELARVVRAVAAAARFCFASAPIAMAPVTTLRLASARSFLRSLATSV